jgi:hypothetical protein
LLLSCILRAVLDKTVGDKGAGLFDSLLEAFLGTDAIMQGSMADLLFEEAAEGSHAFKAHLIADLRNGKLVPGKAFPGQFDPFTGKILVWGQLVDAGKKPVEMKTGQAGGTGYPLQVDGFGKIAVDIQFCRDDLFIYVWSYGH